jgi:hypothetical protein
MRGSDARAVLVAIETHRGYLVNDIPQFSS